MNRVYACVTAMLMIAGCSEAVYTPDLDPNALEAHYHLSVMAFAGGDSIPARADVTLRVRGEGHIDGRYRFDRNVVVPASGPVTGVTLDGSELRIQLGSAGVVAVFPYASPRLDIRTGHVEVTEFGVTTRWPATLTRTRDLLDGVFLFRLPYASQDPDFVGQLVATVSLEDVAVDSLLLRGEVMDFGWDSVLSVRTRVSESLDFDAVGSFRDGEVAFQMPAMLGLTVPCQGAAVAWGISGSCTFGSQSANRIGFSMVRLPEGWRAHRVLPEADTLYEVTRPVRQGGRRYVGLTPEYNIFQRLVVEYEDLPDATVAVAELQGATLTDIRPVPGMRFLDRLFTDSANYLYTTVNSWIFSINPDWEAEVVHEGAEWFEFNSLRSGGDRVFGRIRGEWISLYQGNVAPYPPLELPAIGDSVLRVRWRYEDRRGMLTKLIAISPPEASENTRLALARLHGEEWEKEDLGVSEEDLDFLSGTPFPFVANRTVHDVLPFCRDSTMEVYGPSPCPLDQVTTRVRRLHSDGMFTVDMIDGLFEEFVPSEDEYEYLMRKSYDFEIVRLSPTGDIAEIVFRVESHMGEEPPLDIPWAAVGTDGTIVAYVSGGWLISKAGSIW